MHFWNTLAAARVEPPEMGNGPQAAISLGAPAVRRFGPYDWACKKSTRSALPKQQHVSLDTAKTVELPTV